MPNSSSGAQVSFATGGPYALGVNFTGTDKGPLIISGLVLVSLVFVYIAFRDKQGSV